jgi:hypothetical protein
MNALCSAQSNRTHYPAPADSSSADAARGRARERYVPCERHGHPGARSTNPAHTPNDRSPRTLRGRGADPGTGRAVYEPSSRSANRTLACCE